MKIKNCILVNGNHSISVKCSQSKGTASFKYYGIKPLPGHFPDGDEINTDIQLTTGPRFNCPRNIECKVRK